MHDPERAAMFIYNGSLRLLCSFTLVTIVAQFILYTLTIPIMRKNPNDQNVKLKHYSTVKKLGLCSSWGHQSIKGGRGGGDHRGDGL